MVFFDTISLGINHLKEEQNKLSQRMKNPRISDRECAQLQDELTEVANEIRRLEQYRRDNEDKFKGLDGPNQDK